MVSPASYCSSMQEELALLPLTVKHKKRLIEEYGSLENSLEKGEAFKVGEGVGAEIVKAANCVGRIEKGWAHEDYPRRIPDDV